MRLTLLLLLLIPALASAHGGTPSFEREVDGYLVDIGYNDVGIRPGEEVTFDFDLFTQSGALAFAHFTEVDVDFVLNGASSFSTIIQNKEPNVPTLKHVFEKSGTYAMNVRFIDGEKTLVETSFDVPVATYAGIVGRAEDTAMYILAAFCVLLSAAIIVQRIVYR